MRLFAPTFTLLLALLLASSAAFAAPVTVDTSASASATGSSAQRKTFFDSLNNTHWAFYYNGTAIEYSYSVDGDTWASAGTLAYNTASFSVVYKTISGTSYVFVVVEANTYDVVVLRGELDESAVTFDVPQLVFDGTGVSDRYVKPTVAISGNSHLWLSAIKDFGVGSSQRFRVQVRRSSNLANADISLFGAITQIDVGYPVLGDAVIMPQGGDEMCLIFSTGGNNVVGYTFDGAQWSSANAGGDYSWFGFGKSGLGGIASAIVVSGNDIYVAGSFSDAGGVSGASNIARWDGNYWHALGDGLDSSVLAIAISGNDIFVGGHFENAGGIAAADRIARWDGESWNAVGSGLNDAVYTLAVSGNDLYVGGDFTNAGGIAAADRIARWDGGSWNALGSGLNAIVLEVVVSGVDLYVGGGFTDAGGIGNADYLARWDGASWNAVGSVLDSTVSAIAISASDVYVGGNFLNAGGIAAADRIARWDGVSWNALGAGLDSSVLDIAINGTDVYAVGYFENAGGLAQADRVARWDGNSWNALGTGLTVGGAVSFGVSTVVVSGSDVFVGGGFFDAGGVIAANGIARWDGGNWNLFDSGINNIVNVIVINGSDVYVGGHFTGVGGNPNANYIARWNGSSWNSLGNGIPAGGYSSAPSRSVSAIAISGGNVYVGGNFTNAGGVANATRIARWNGTNWSAMGTGIISGEVFAIAISGANVYIGGSFGAVGGVANTSRIARWNGASWNAVGTGLGSVVTALAVSGADLYVGGHFLNAGAIAEADRIARWNGASWNALGVGISNGNVNAIAISGSDVFVGGNFTGAGAVAAADYIARWDGTSWNALSSGLSNSVSALAISGSDLYVAGTFADAGGVAEADRIARWDGASWSALDVELSDSVYAIAAAGSSVYAGGYFNIVGTSQVTTLAHYAPALAFDADASTEVSATSDSSGDVYLVYTNNVDQTKFRRFDQSDAQWDEAVLLNSTVSTAPTISFKDSDGRITVSWVEANVITYSHARSPYEVGDWSVEDIHYNTGISTGLITAAHQETADLPVIWTNGAGSPYSVMAYQINMSAPTVVISSSAASPTNVNPIPVTFSFNKDVSGVVVGDVSVGNGSIGNFVAVDGSIYTAEITPSGQGNVTVDLPGAVALDAFGNNNVAAIQFGVTFDSVSPITSISSGVLNPTNASPFTVLLEFDEDVVGFQLGDITVGNGVASNFVAISGDSYTADITPATDGVVVIGVAGGVAQDAAGNPNIAATQFSTIYDNTVPTVSVLSPGASVNQSNKNVFFVSGACSENNRAVNLSVVSSAGGATVSTTSTCSAGGWSRNLNLSGLNDGTLTITADHDDSVGLDAMQASQAFIKETVAPSVVISSNLASPIKERTIPIVVQFSEDVTGFTAADIILENATLNGFTSISAQQYRATLEAVVTGTIVVKIAANVASDGAGNPNFAATQFSITYELSESEIEIDTVCSVWNSFFNKADGAVWNILEHVNSGTETLAIETTLYSRDGIAQSTARFVIPPEQRQLDLLVHDMEGWAANSYGLVCSKVTSGASSDLDGRMVYYRQKQAGGFEYIFASPFSRGNLGRQFVGFNTYQPSLNSNDRANFVANWIQVTNLEDDTQSGELRFYNQAGVLLKSERLTVPGIGQSDISAHEWEVPMVGLVEWRPVDEQARFIVRNTRYLYDNAEMRERFDGVIQVAASDGSKEMLSAMLDTQDASAVLELANITGSDAQSKVRFYDAEGELLADLDFTLAAHSTQHVVADAILSNSTGSVTVAVPDAEVKSLIATVIQYGREPSGSISYLYGTTALRPVSDVLRSSYNTFLGQGCELHLLNQSEAEQTATVAMQRNNGTQVFGSSTLTLRPMQSVVSNICAAELEQAYGVVTLTTDHGAAFQPFLLRTDGSGGSRYPVPVR